MELLRLSSKLPRSAVEVASDHVPANTAIREVVKGAEAPGQLVGVLVARRGRQTERQVLGGSCHGRDK